MSDTDCRNLAGNDNAFVEADKMGAHSLYVRFSCALFTGCFCFDCIRVCSSVFGHERLQHKTKIKAAIALVCGWIALHVINAQSRHLANWPNKHHSERF